MWRKRVSSNVDLLQCIIVAAPRRGHMRWECGGGVLTAEEQL